MDPDQLHRTWKFSKHLCKFISIQLDLVACQLKFSLCVGEFPEHFDQTSLSPNTVSRESDQVQKTLVLEYLLMDYQ